MLRQLFVAVLCVSTAASFVEVPSFPSAPDEAERCHCDAGCAERGDCCDAAVTLCFDARRLDVAANNSTAPADAPSSSPMDSNASQPELAAPPQKPHAEHEHEAAAGNGSKHDQHAAAAARKPHAHDEREAEKDGKGGDKGAEKADKADKGREAKADKAKGAKEKKERSKPAAAESSDRGKGKGKAEPASREGRKGKDRSLLLLGCTLLFLVPISVSLAMVMRARGCCGTRFSRLARDEPNGSAGPSRLTPVTEEQALEMIEAPR
ncbi:hypothetical protein EMIHUDRAFT_115264 [Emiliania huxleyi CCMP1516]|uniref:SMB domain-containing protein n=2 Tax=Emiliania huxleyi TaxID=2903 RepID=A0A0D3JRA5_EMIH1|nr:hypothetical protein EMIHUDRAFT_115264 [Emiliania huxleyi CCMP1516]EOD26040.1 hypothetical protein EMIHUDRAFT_115264 [Emiliania huxleyi CCMP1516]|eukprot:XP_005778469.1 hypothetical protein EMIHUDRAFT_115264 [Emiliania huxleyi CCMP1516]